MFPSVSYVSNSVERVTAKASHSLIYPAEQRNRGGCFKPSKQIFCPGNREADQERVCSRLTVKKLSKSLAN